MNKEQIKKPNANAVGATCGRPQDHKGITLVALIITIIVMLILVGVSITIAIKGGLFNISKRAAKDTKTEIEAEQELSNGRVKIGGIWYDSIEDYVGGKPSEDQKESSIKFSYEPKGWTSGPVKVKIETEGELQYSTDRVTWTNYTEEIEVKNNETIYAKEAGNSKEEKIVIENIDKEAPTVTTDLSLESKTITSINLEMVVEDTLSGISEIKWYYKKDGASGDYETLTDQYAGEKEVKATKELSKLERGSKYNIYVEIYDIVGNKKRIPETGTTDIETNESFLGRSATINGQKYIVLYDAGEQGENVQLVSANVLEPGSVYLGHQDGQVKWTNSDVKAEADLDNNNTLDDVEKAIYSYNHAVETLNKKCQELVGNTNTDIVSVRSVGSNPVNPNNDTSTFYTSDFLANNPSSAQGMYNGKAKSGDENYLTDYNRMQELEISVAENGETYWLASRWTYENHANTSDAVFHLRIRTILDTRGDLDFEYPLRVMANAAEVTAKYFSQHPRGLRPVISIKSDSLSKYLD